MNRAPAKGNLRFCAVKFRSFLTPPENQIDLSGTGCRGATKFNQLAFRALRILIGLPQDPRIPTEEALLPAV